MVRAAISVDSFDINNLQKGVRFFIDTNVWYWHIGGEGISARQYQLDKYPAFIEKLLDKGVQIFHSTLTLIELARLIEHRECERHGFTGRLKEFRANEALRAKVVRSVSLAVRSVAAASQCLEERLGNGFSASILKHLGSYQMDPYDAANLELLIRDKINFVVSDDADFYGVDSVSLITANRKVLGG